MKRAITFLLLLTLVFSTNAQNKDDKKAVRVTIQNFFKGFHNLSCLQSIKLI